MPRGILGVNNGLIQRHFVHGLLVLSGNELTQMLAGGLGLMHKIHYGNDFSAGGAKIGEKQSRQSNSKHNFMQ